MKSAENELIQNRPKAMEKLFDFLRIPSISTDAKWADACVKAADWLVTELSDIGFDARTVSTGGHPLVVAHSPKIVGAPHVLFYGHYDVQPGDPADKWELDPFEPAIVERGGVQIIHGRGASDDKGQVMTFIEACRAHKQAGQIPINVTMLIEGEEEIGSPSIETCLEEFKDELSADIALICDTAMLDDDTPAMASQLRGFVGEIITITAASTDLHSGNYGGPARNPAQVLATALAEVKNKDGSINLPGFYDGVSDIADELKADWGSLEAVGSDLLPEVGLNLSAGEEGRTILEQVWARPCFDINGIWSGYTGEGFKTVLPSQAHAKVSFRLVGKQVPDDIRESFRDLMRRHVPADCEIEFTAFGNVPATEMAIDRPEFQKAKQAIKGIWPNPCVFIGMGGSIPIVGSLKTQLNVDSILLGFAKANDQIHAPNEKYDVESFEKGAVAWLRIIQTLAVKK